MIMPIYSMHMIHPNAFICGDNLSVMKDMESESVDLIYLDPPYYSQTKYEDVNGEFDDKWESMDDYLAFMKPRIVECRRILKIAGMIFLHCDFHANAYLRVMLDEIFGYNRFVHEIVWKRRISSNFSEKSLGNIHDTIYLYSKSKDFTMYPLYTDRKMDKVKNLIHDAYGIFYTTPMVHTRDCKGHKASGKTRIIFGVKYTLPENAHWYCTQEKIEMLEREHKIFMKNGMKYPRTKEYIDNKVRINDIWDDLILAYSKEEFMKFPTQKPIALIERIFSMCSKEGDIIFDPFVGSGTSIVAAKKMRRLFIGIEQSKRNYAIAKKRIQSAVVSEKLKI